MERKVKVGIIGCGGICNGKHMKALTSLNYVEIVALCDIIVERAYETRDKFKLGENVAVYEDYKELLKDESIEVVHVLTPNRSHSFITIDALEAGKHVMCEKPMAKTAAEAQAMLDAAKRTGKKLTIGYQSRWRDEYL
ncbi:MAG: Gfo/Idh/MocA family oxidoreductase, partial [Acutalibacteraceae bacterium]|nr:Gfo/Idh/MocA family oxidoreductase [Acutalibacteraceae bacterium]